MPKPKRHHDQSFGYWLNEPAILDHRRIIAAMADLAVSGYGIVRVIVRQTILRIARPRSWRRSRAPQLRRTNTCMRTVGRFPVPRIALGFT